MISLNAKRNKHFDGIDGIGFFFYSNFISKYFQIFKRINNYKLICKYELVLMMTLQAPNNGYMYQDFVLKQPYNADPGFHDIHRFVAR